MGRELFLSVVFLMFIFIVLIFSDYIFLNDFYYLKNALVSIAITIFIMCMIEKKWHKKRRACPSLRNYPNNRVTSMFCLQNMALSYTYILAKNQLYIKYILQTLIWLALNIVVAIPHADTACLTMTTLNVECIADIPHTNW